MFALLHKMYRIIKTSDGSDTIYSEQFGTHYHSLNGALTESLHIYINNGLNYAKEKFNQLSVLEIGLGTSLNAGLTFALNSGIEINYTGIEQYPLPYSIISKLYYGDYTRIIQKMCNCEWNQSYQLSDNFKFTKIKGDFITHHFSETINLVYFDAFDPSKQSKLWEIPVLQKIYKLMATEGVMVTFCAKGEFKRNLRKAGFTVETLMGPPGKREMVRAFK